MRYITDISIWHLVRYMFLIVFSAASNHQTRGNRKLMILKYLLAMELLIVLNLPK